MFNKILALLFIFIFNSNALADSITTLPLCCNVAIPATRLIEPEDAVSVTPDL